MTDTKNTNCPECDQKEEQHAIDMQGVCYSCIMKQIHAEEDLRNQADNDVLELIEKQVTKEDYQKILNSIEDSETTYDYKILTEAKGLEIIDDKYTHGLSRVEQLTNGGMIGDEFAGNIYIPISEKEFFKYTYSI